MKFKDKESSCQKEFLAYLEVMPASHVKTYIRDRVLEQVKWYDHNCKHNQKCYKNTMLASIIMSAITPVVIIAFDLGFQLYLKIFVGVLGAGVTALSAINTLYCFRDIWVQYRVNCELLKSTLHTYFVCADSFKNLSDSERDTLLIEKCEQLMVAEFRGWSQSIPTQEKICQPSTNS